MFKRFGIPALLFIVSHTATPVEAQSIERTYTYEGDRGARSICLAIANNQVSRLNRALNSKKFGRLDKGVHKRFTCNGENLLIFAEKMKAMRAAKFLSNRFFTESLQSPISITKNSARISSEKSLDSSGSLLN